MGVSASARTGGGFSLLRRQACAASSPDERSDIREGSNIAPDIAALIRATLAAGQNATYLIGRCATQEDGDQLGGLVLEKYGELSRAIQERRFVVVDDLQHAQCRLGACHVSFQLGW